MRLLYAFLYILCVIMLCSDADPAEAYSRTLQNHAQPAFSQCHNTPDSAYTLATQPLYTYKRVYRPKSYIFGVGGAAILPLIGHSYIGGWNSSRGVVYTAAELFLSVVVFGFYYIPIPYTSRRDYELAKIKHRYAIAALACTHAVNIIDAYFSVWYKNKKARQREISVAIIPDIHSRGMRLVWLF